MNVFLDIETIPAQPEDEAKKLIAETISAPATMKKPETIEAWHNGDGKYEGAKDALIEEKYRRTSFDAAQGEIISIAFAIEDGPVFNYNRSLYQPEEDLLIYLFQDLFDPSGRRPFFIGHYIGKFDLKFLFQRAVILGINPGLDLNQHGRHGKDFYDTMLAWAGYGNTISLDNLCKALRIKGKPNDIDGSKVWDFVKAGKINEVGEYNKNDVELVREVYNRLNFKPANTVIAA